MEGMYLSRRQVLKGVALTVAGAGLGGASVLAYAHVIEPAWLDVHPVTVPVRRLADALHGYRIAQISDLHLGDWLTPAQLAQVVQTVNQQHPDLIAVTGDFVTSHAQRHAPDLMAALRLLRAGDGVVAVLGNHDYWSDAQTIRAVIQASGMRDLSNRAYTIERDGAPLHIAGVDDVWEARARLDHVLAALPAAGPAILLAHEPDFADTSAATGRFALQISGHSHGGQIVVPRYGPLRLPPYGRRYPLGHYRVGTMLQYTNRGIGMLRPHVRLNCRPEITVFTLAATE